MRHLKVALIYNAFTVEETESPIDQGGSWSLRHQIKSIARAIRSVGHEVHVIPVTQDFPAFQSKLLVMKPDVIFNQYDDVVHGALYEMRIAALVRILGFPLTGCPALGLGLSRYKYMSASLLQGVGIPTPPDTMLLEKIGDVDRHSWRFPVIVQPSQEHAGIGLERNSVIHTKKDLRLKARHILTAYKQPALVQRFLTGREFNVGLVGGKRIRVLPLAEVDYSRLPSDIPPIMSYAAKWEENTVEFKQTSVICPAQVDPELAEVISKTAARAFRAVGGWGYGRVDIRLDDEGIPRVLEVNCNPLLDRGVGIARSAEKAGIGYGKLLQIIIKAAFEGPPNDLSLAMPPKNTSIATIEMESAVAHVVKRPL
jgi:D-alanine-D-alanine ligase